MSELIRKLNEIKNCSVKTSVSQIGQTKDFKCHVEASIFNPEKFIPNGGPITVKHVIVEAMGRSFEDAQNNGLEKAASLLGLQSIPNLKEA